MKGTGAVSRPLNDGDAISYVPIIMYHHVKPQKAGEYCITPEEFEADLLFLKEKGFVTVTVSELISFVNGSFGMPPKPVILTFDDGRYNNYTQAFPLLKKHDCKASFFIIGAFAEKFSGGRPQYEQTSYLSFDNIKEMAASGLCDIQSHSYNLHDWSLGRMGANMKKDESLDDYRKALETDLKRNRELLARNCAITPDAFAYPFGEYNQESEKIIASLGLSATLTTNDGINTVRRGNGSSLFGLKRFNRPHSVSCEVFLKKILKEK